VAGLDFGQIAKKFARIRVAGSLGGFFVKPLGVALHHLGFVAHPFKFEVFHQPNGKFPKLVAKKLGFEDEKIKQGFLTPMIGNTYSGASMVGLASVLDVAKPGEKILVVSYGSGAGSDAFVLEATKNISKKRAKVAVLKAIENKEYVDYSEYLIHRKKIKTLHG